LNISLEFNKYYNIFTHFYELFCLDLRHALKKLFEITWELKNNELSFEFSHEFELNTQTQTSPKMSYSTQWLDSK